MPITERAYLAAMEKIEPCTEPSGHAWHCPSKERCYCMHCDTDAPVELVQFVFPDGA